MNNEEWKDGVPDVGVVCEFPTNGGDYDTCEVKGVNGVDAWIHNDVIGHKIVRINILRPIKKREPKPGEVWLVESVSEPGMVLVNCKRLCGITSGVVFLPDGRATKFLAPDVKSYIARELLKEEETSKFGPLGVTKKAARLDEE